MALSFYATGSYQRLVGGTYGTMMSQQSVSRAIKDVTAALNNEGILNKWLKFPQTRQQRDSIKRRYLHSYILLSFSYFSLVKYCICTELSKYIQFLSYFILIIMNTLFECVEVISTIYELSNNINSCFRFYEKFRIPAVEGCIDGTHIAIIKPAQNEERFYNRKGFHSRNVLIVSNINETHSGSLFHKSFC